MIDVFLGEVMYKDFHWLGGVEYDYRREHNCETYGCNYEGICRCSRIFNAHVTSINTVSVRNAFITTKMSCIDRYCVDRILVINKFYDPEYFDLETGSDYYGEEIQSVNLSNEKEIEKSINHVLSLRKNSDKIEYVLNLEYGSLLNSLKNKTWKIRSVKKEELIFGDHINKLSSAAVERYKKEKSLDIPLGICLKVTNKYKVMDGYHRCSASADKKVMIICSDEE